MRTPGVELAAAEQYDTTTELMPLVQIGDVVCNTNLPDPEGVYWWCEDLKGWGSPGSTLQVTQRSGDHGGWDGDAHLVPRVMEIKGLLLAPSAAAARDALSRLYEAVPLSPSPLTVTEAGLTRTCMVRRQDDVLPVWVSTREVEWSAQVVAPDPRRYGPQQVLSTGLPSSSGGLRWPVRWPQRWEAEVTSGVIRIEHEGTIATRPRLVITGPCPPPRVALVGTGRQLAWNLALADGQWLDVDMDRKTSLLNGQVSRSGAMTERGWFELPPREASEIAFSAASYDPGASLTVVHRPAWM